MSTEPLRTVVDLSLGEAREVELWDGQKARVQLLDVEERTDALRDAIREARVRVRINGQEAWVPCASYNLPRAVAGVQVDCPVTRGYYRKSGEDAWGLVKDARLRLWPIGSPLIEPDTFVYPARQRWFATDTQMCNEPCFVNAAEYAGAEKVYYHYGLDIGGAEGMVEIVSSTDGTVLTRGEEARADIADFEYTPRYDRVAILDARGWLHMFSHLKTIEDAIQVGAQVEKGQKIGMLGKEGTSGGWSHLHFGIKARQPSGKWGAEEAYAYLWEAYVREQKPAVIAVARPHHFVKTGESVTLDGSRSWSREGKIVQYDWTFTDGFQATGATVTRRYEKAGYYSEILRVKDSQRNEDVDFAVVHVIDEYESTAMIPVVHAVYYPTFGLRPGDAVHFGVRAFRAEVGDEVWDFGDGSPPVRVKSNPVKPNWRDSLAPDGYAFTVHRYARPGRYIATVEHMGRPGVKCLARVHVLVTTG